MGQEEYHQLTSKDDKACDCLPDKMRGRAISKILINIVLWRLCSLHPEPGRQLKRSEFEYHQIDLMQSLTSRGHVSRRRKRRQML